MLTADRFQLLHLDGVARVNLLRDARDECGGGAPVDAQDDDLADDEARDGRASAFDRGRLDRRAVLAAVNVLHALRRERESAAFKFVALEAAARVARDLAARLHERPVALGPEDRQAVADAHVVLGPEVEEDDLVARERPAPLARAHAVAGLLSPQLGAAVQA